MLNYIEIPNFYPMVENIFDITIFQGGSWEEPKFYHPRNLSAGVARGQIRSDYLDLGGLLYAEFDFYPLVYGLVTFPTAANGVERTIIAPKLSALKTSAVPVTDRCTWVYDIFVQIGQESIEIARGRVNVVPRVTGGI